MSDELQVAETTETPEVATEQTQTPATEPASNEANQTRNDDDELEERLPKGVRKSIDRLTRQKYELQAERDAYRREIEQLRQGQNQPVKQAQPEAPTLEQFGGDWDKYIEAKAEYVADKKFAEREAQQSQRQSQEQAQRVQMDAASNFQRAAHKASQVYPDFEEVMGTSEAIVTPAMQQAIFALGETGPDVAYYLAKNPDEADRIARMSPYAAAAEIGFIRTKAARPDPVKKVSQAPAPVGSVKGSAPVQKDPSKMTDSEYYAWKQSLKSQGVKRNG
jgi:Asp-tRNA(Asn)/Glu-tRNA(Gln) amidotransferase A subunit family amidase